MSQTVVEYEVRPRLTGAQWKSGIAAWLGWLFDGLDMHLYTIVAASFVGELMLADPTSAAVKEKSSYIQAAFLIGWALGGGFFGRIGDRLGRARALALTIITYAAFTGLSSVSQTWWQLMIFRFLAALGIGGEWAVGSSLLSETWPKSWRPWIAAVLQTAVNIGVMLAYVATYLFAGFTTQRYVFLVGVLPALVVFWIRRSVPEPEEWHTAATSAAKHPPMADLFRGRVRRITLLTIVVCACSLTAWWAYMFWTPQLMRQLPEVASWTPADKNRLASTTLGVLIGCSIPGNFFAGWLAKLAGFRRGIALMCVGFFLSVYFCWNVPRSHTVLLWVYIPLVGFFSGIFGLFTMYLPPLFPTLLRTTGAGFSYNIGRIVAAVGTVVFGKMAVNNTLGDLRQPLLYGAFLFIPATVAALLLPDLKDAPAGPVEPVE
ncbi:MAG TPA: MFS transporter [Tepidisphaeraceae bacterium]|jgi:MFS family permease